MTDKKEFDQKDLNVAFEQLKQNENLEPSAKLDALILNMAAEELTTGVAEEKSNVTDISDISFRRGQREAHKALKKKGIFPAWAMPLGLAATVLLSFGVVNRVLLSPEFDSLTKQSSYEVMSDDVIVGTDSESKVSAKKDDASFNKSVQPEIVQAKRLRAENADAKIIINGNEMNADISFSDKPLRAPAKSAPPPPETAIVSAQSATPVEVARYNDRDMDRVQASSSELESDKKTDKEQLLMDSRQEQHAELAKEKRERLTRRRDMRERMQAETVHAPMVIAQPPIASAAPSLGDIDSVEEVVVAGAIQAEAVPSLSEAESVEELVAVGNRAKNDTSGYSMAGDDMAGTDIVAEAKSQDLQSLLFEHKQCQVKQDCALVALECDGCDCLDAVNLENYSKYRSEFSQAEIAEQCIDTSVECVRNYCQVQQVE